MTSAPWWGRYIGIPFVDRGFDLAGCHCWGLIWLVYRNERGVDLPTYGEISASDLIAIAREIDAGKCDPWVPVVGERRPFDVQTMWSRIKIDGAWMRDQGHVGIMVSPTHMLHVEYSTAAVCVPLTDRSVRYRLLQTFRHKALA